MRETLKAWNRKCHLAMQKMQFCGRWKTIARSYTYVGLHEQLQWVFATQTGFLPTLQCIE